VTLHHKDYLQPRGYVTVYKWLSMSRP